MSEEKKMLAVEGFKLEELQKKVIPELIVIAKELKIDNPQELRKMDLIFEILKAQTSEGGFLLFTGILEITDNGYGFLRSLDGNFQYSTGDTYVSQSQIKKFALRQGDIITGQVRPPMKETEKFNGLLQIEAINYMPIKKALKRPLFDNLTPLYSTKKFKFEYQKDKLTGRLLDLFAPMGRGQRGLIVAPPKTGKTEFLKELAHGISRNHPEVELIVLLVDERPEEVTDMQRSIKGEVFYSTFDLPAQNHVRVAEMVLDKAKRRVEMGKDVVILLDSITRLARAYNTVTPNSGKILSGGVDANALHKPKRFFGAARNIEEGGSLTIISTALIETGSKMDEVIFEEFKGTGNSEIVLSRKASNKRIYPAIDIIKSGTRKEELLVSEKDLKKIWAIRNTVVNMEEVESLSFLCRKLKQTDSNDDFFKIMNS